MIDPSIAAVLRSRYTIRRFFILYGAILIGLLVLMVVLAAALELNSTARDVSVSFLGNFAATVAIFIITFAFYILVTPSGLRNAEVLPLRSAEIADGIVDLREDASDYWFWGRSGGFFRAEVLPRLDALARKERRHISLRVVLPDPEESRNAIRYSAMKRGLGEEADETTLVANVLATVAASIIAATRNPYLHVRIGLCATIPVLRHDISSRGALITRDAPTLPAILMNANNPYFEMFKDAVENELAQSRLVTWDAAAPAFHQAEEPTVKEVLSTIFGLPNVDEKIVGRAENILKSKVHRYV